MPLLSAGEPAPLQATTAAPRPVADLAPQAFAPGARRPGGPLRPDDLLQLQRTQGNRATLQRLHLQRQPSVVQRDDPEAGAAEADLQRRLAEARASLLEASQRDGAMYMARASSLADDLREPLYEDDALTTGLRGSFHGLNLMVARMRVRYANQPSWVRQFTQAVRDPDTRKIADLLRAYPGLRDPQMGVLEVLDAELGGNAALPELKRLVQEQTLQQGQVVGVGSSVKYDKAEDAKGKRLPGQPPELRQHLVKYRFILQRTGSELRVIVRIRLLVDNPVPPGARQTAYPPEAKLNEWRSGIESTWNNRFRAANGTTRLKIVFVPIFNAEELPHFELFYVEGEGQSHTGDHGEFFSEANGPVIAHEFGHMIGNPDEYDLPAKIEDIPANFSLSEEEKKRSNYKSLTQQDAPFPAGGMGKTGNAVKDSIMGDYGQAHQRHIWQVLQHFNADVKPADEAEFKLEGGVA